MGAAGWANVIAVLALLGAVVGWADNRRGVKRAEDVSERAAQAQERMAQALEQADARHAAEAPTPEPVWALKHVTGIMYVLENIGTGPGFDVTVQPPEHAAFFQRTPMPVGKVSPGETVEFDCALSLAAGGETTVTYSAAEGGGQETWVRTVPPSTGR